MLILSVFIWETGLLENSAGRDRYTKRDTLIMSLFVSRMGHDVCYKSEIKLIFRLCHNYTRQDYFTLSAHIR